MTEDLSILFADFGIPAIWVPSYGGAQKTGLVILDQGGSATLGGMAISTEYAITFRSSDFDGLEHGEEITVGGRAYRVREVMPQQDGALSTASLARI